MCITSAFVRGLKPTDARDVCNRRGMGLVDLVTLVLAAQAEKILAFAGNIKRLLRLLNIDATYVAVLRNARPASDGLQLIPPPSVTATHANMFSPCSHGAAATKVREKSGHPFNSTNRSITIVDGNRPAASNATEEGKAG